MLMFSGHPGVTASELMASGYPVVVSEYKDLIWDDLQKYGASCIVSLPVANEVVYNIHKCLVDTSLKQAKIPGGKIKVEEFYPEYQDSIVPANKTLLDEIT